MTPFADPIFEDAVFAWLEGMGWPVAHGPDIVADMLAPERINSDEVVQVGQLCDATMLQ